MFTVNLNFTVLIFSLKKCWGKRWRRENKTKQTAQHLLLLCSDNRTRRGDGRLQGHSSWSPDHKEPARWTNRGRQRTQHTRTFLGGYETPVTGNADGTRLPVEKRHEVCFPLSLSSPAPHLHARHITETEPLRSGQAPAGRWAARLSPGAAALLSAGRRKGASTKEERAKKQGNNRKGFRGFYLPSHILWNKMSSSSKRTGFPSFSSFFSSPPHPLFQKIHL